MNKVCDIMSRISCCAGSEEGTFESQCIHTVTVKASSDNALWTCRQQLWEDFYGDLYRMAERIRLHDKNEKGQQETIIDLIEAMKI